MLFIPGFHNWRNLILPHNRTLCTFHRICTRQHRCYHHDKYSGNGHRYNRDSTLLFILCKISLGQSSDIQKLISLPAAFLSLTASLVTHSFYFWYLRRHTHRLHQWQIHCTQSHCNCQQINPPIIKLDFSFSYNLVCLCYKYVWILCMFYKLEKYNFHSNCSDQKSYRNGKQRHSHSLS